MSSQELIKNVKLKRAVVKRRITTLFNRVGKEDDPDLKGLKELVDQYIVEIKVFDSEINDLYMQNEITDG